MKFFHDYDRGMRAKDAERVFNEMLITFTDLCGLCVAAYDDFDVLPLHKNVYLVRESKEFHHERGNNVMFIVYTKIKDVLLESNAIDEDTYISPFYGSSPSQSKRVVEHIRKNYNSKFPKEFYHYGLYGPGDIFCEFSVLWDNLKDNIIPQNPFPRLVYTEYTPGVGRILHKNKRFGNKQHNIKGPLLIASSKLQGKIPTVPFFADDLDKAPQDGVTNIKLITKPLLTGIANPMLRGDISNKYGNLEAGLKGDISGITGMVTNLIGDATGIKLHIPVALNEVTDIKLLADRKPGKEQDIKHKVLTLEENERLWNVYRKIAHCTLGLSDEERALIDAPVKVQPPFPVDKFGRCYIEKDDKLWIYSVNPADLMFLKETNHLQTCFCVTSVSGFSPNRWSNGMRCLMALNITNPNLGCIFAVNKDSVKQMRMFKGLKFKWFNPIEGSYFQYTKDKYYVWRHYMGDPLNLTNRDNNIDEIRDVVEPIYGHDGVYKGHERQDRLAFVETFIKDEYSYIPEAEAKDGQVKIASNAGGIVIDSEYNVVERIGCVYFNEEKIIADYKKSKEIIDGIEI